MQQTHFDMYAQDYKKQKIGHQGLNIHD
jgi:hypothetical protein